MTPEQIRMWKEKIKGAKWANQNPMVKLYGFGPEGKICKTCAHLWSRKFNKTYYKCEFRLVTKGPGTDHRVGWMACGRYDAS